LSCLPNAARRHNRALCRSISHTAAGVAPRMSLLPSPSRSSVSGSRQHRERGGAGLAADISSVAAQDPSGISLRYPVALSRPAWDKGYGGRPKSASQRCSRHLVRVRGCPRCRADILMTLRI
jgi:hypothetical protein